ncbi:MAG: hypothetical protein JFR38_08520 [Muribaculaceae bacterium]|nr:hypothetical protein [Muribaculaceae bacterium]
MEITKIWFDAGRIYGLAADGRTNSVTTTKNARHTYGFQYLHLSSFKLSW